jgi:hypothetical protein
MEEYIVSTKGTVTIEAENPEEAEEKARGSLGVGGRHEVLSVEAEPMNHDSDHFQLKLSKCGTNKANSSYRLMKDKSALGLAYRAVHNMSKDFVAPDNTPPFRFELALLLLSGIEGDDINRENIWKGRCDLREKVHDKGLKEVVSEMWAIREDPEEVEN